LSTTKKSSGEAICTIETVESSPEIDDTLPPLKRSGTVSASRVRRGSARRNRRRSRSMPSSSLEPCVLKTKENNLPKKSQSKNKRPRSHLHKEEKQRKLSHKNANSATTTTTTDQKTQSYDEKISDNIKIERRKSFSGDKSHKKEDSGRKNKLRLENSETNPENL